jgi:transposase-like protein
MGEALCKRRHGNQRRSGQSWYADETYLKVHGRWCCYLYRAIVGNPLGIDLEVPLARGGKETTIAGVARRFTRRLWSSHPESPPSAARSVRTEGGDRWHA